VPLSQIAEMVGLASGETGSAQKDVRRKTMFVAAIANGIGPLSVLKNATSGAVLDELRDGPLDKHGGGSRILDVDAKVRRSLLEASSRLRRRWSTTRARRGSRAGRSTMRGSHR